jgi:hypothetical protein
MKLEKMVDDTQETIKRVDEIFGLWDPCSLVADLAGGVGTLSYSILIVEGKRPAPPEDVHLAHDIGTTLLMLIRIGNHYNIDLERAWNDMIQEGQENLARLENREVESKND